MREKGDIIFTEADIIFTGGKDAALPFLIINNSLYIPILDRIWTILITIAVPIKERSRIDTVSNYLRIFYKICNCPKPVLGLMLRLLTSIMNNLKCIVCVLPQLSQV
jgi:hypothetical protein